MWLTVDDLQHGGLGAAAREPVVRCERGKVAEDSARTVVVPTVGVVIETVGVVVPTVGDAGPVVGVGGLLVGVGGLLAGVM